MAVEVAERKGRMVRLIRPDDAPAPEPQKTKSSKGKDRERRRKKTVSNANKFRARRLAKRTEAELGFQSILESLEIEYIPEKTVYLKGHSFRFLDFFLPEYGVAVEIDGGYHFTGEQLEADFWREVGLLNKISILKIVRFSNEEVLKQPRDKTIIKLISTICPVVLKVFPDEIMGRLMEQDNFDSPKYGMY